MRIVLLEKERWKGYILPMPQYTAREHYAVSVERTPAGFAVSLERRPLPAPRTFTPEMYASPDRLYADHFADARAYGMFDGETLAAVMELCPESWNNRMRVTELWVREGYRRRGRGSRLLAFALVLETQSCNTDAIAFYLHEGLSLIGLDTCCYSNEDIARGEVRLELGAAL